MKNPDSRIKMLIMAACIAVVHALALLIFGLYKYIRLEIIESTYLLVISSVFLAIEIASVIFARIKRLTVFLKGLFLYKLIGVVFFVIAWGINLKTSGTTQSFFAIAFSWFSLATQPVATLISPFVHLSIFFRRGLVFAVMTYATGAMVSGIRNEQKYEKKMTEAKNPENFDKNGK